MFKVIATGPRAEIEAAWDALAWADPSPAGAVDAKEDTRTTWRLSAYAETEEAAQACLDLIAATASELSARYEALPERDWVAMSLEGLPPVEAGPFFVAGEHAIKVASPGKTAITIEAGPAFGTGHHGTTLGCLLAFAETLKHRRPGLTLDLGTGSGVLAIAALKSAATRAIGTDIDPDSVKTALQNARDNHVASLFKAYTCTGTHQINVRMAAPYDTIFANILARPLVKLAPEIASVAAPGANIILSGLLSHQEPQVRGAFDGRGFILNSRIHRDGWSTLLYQKP